MLSLLNKSGGKAKEGRALAWHPNFRNAEQLPDTKTVRTTFFVNAIAITAVAMLAIFVTLRELRLAALTADLAEIEQQITVATPPSQKAVADFKIYQEQEKQFTEAYGFVRDPFRFPDFLMQLADTLPPGVKINRVDFRGPGQAINVSCSVKGLDATASDVASEYVKKLQSDTGLANYFATVVLVNLGRNVTEGNMGLELAFTFKAAKK